MPLIAETPEPPYYAVIFTSLHSDDLAGYEETANRLLELAHQQPGFLGVESARKEVGITVSYWSDLESIKAWKTHAEHKVAKQQGRKLWYSHFKTRIALVERDYDNR